MELQAYLQLVGVPPCRICQRLGAGFKYFLCSPRNLGKDEPILTSIIFHMGLVQPPTNASLSIQIPSLKLT